MNTKDQIIGRQMFSCRSLILRSGGGAVLGARRPAAERSGAHGPSWQARHRLGLGILLCLLLLPASARAVSGTWTNKTGGTWSTAGN
jgi:hypothetical protein